MIRRVREDCSRAYLMEMPCPARGTEMGEADDPSIINGCSGTLQALRACTDPQMMVRGSSLILPGICAVGSPHRVNVRCRPNPVVQGPLDTPLKTRRRKSRQLTSRRPSVCIKRRRNRCRYSPTTTHREPDCTHPKHHHCPRRWLRDGGDGGGRHRKVFGKRFPMASDTLPPELLSINETLAI